MLSRCIFQLARRASTSTPPIRARISTSTRSALPRKTFSSRRAFSISGIQRAPSTADEWVEEITEQYATARDEFEIAMEETEKMTVYAQDDRNAAREELDKLNKMLSDVVNGQDKEVGVEVKKRVSGRVRELQNAVENMEELAIHQD